MQDSMLAFNCLGLNSYKRVNGHEIGLVCIKYSTVSIHVRGLVSMRDSMLAFNCSGMKSNNRVNGHEIGLYR